jgi:transposase-like protein/DNA-directed RNA polymerase subunit RPC12/RpoP
MFLPQNKYLPKGIQSLMQKLYQFHCPKCNNSSNFYRYGKDYFGYQKYLCRNCNHQFAPDNPNSKPKREYPRCPVCGKASFLHHDYQYYSNFRCGDKNCYHSFFVHKPTNILPPSMSKLFGKTDFKRMRYPVSVIIQVLVMFYIGNSSFRKIAFMLHLLHNIKLSHTTVSNWCRNFAPLFDNIALELIPALDFSSDEWHADETVVKINGIKHYIWFIIDSETRFVLGFHLSPRRDSPQAFSLFNSVKHLGKPSSLVSDRYTAYKQPVKSVLRVSHIRVASFKDDISNNLIESFNKQFKTWYKSKQGFNSFDSANNLISLFVFFYNFVRPHSALDDLTPAQVAGLNLSKRQKHKYYLVS